MDKVEKIQTITRRGRNPDDEEINKAVKNQQEKGRYLDDTIVTGFFDNHNGVKEYTVTLIFKGDSTQKNFGEKYFTDELEEQ